MSVASDKDSPDELRQWYICWRGLNTCL